MHDAAEVDALHREAERLRAAAESAERRARAMDAVSAVLAGETTTDTGIPRALASLGAALGGTLAGWWSPDDDGIQLLAQWSDDGSERAMPRHCAPGDGLAGRVWAERSPLWITDVSADRDLAHRDDLALAGARSGFGFPIAIAGDVVGVIELFSRRPEQPEPAMIEFLRTLGTRLGQFVQRANADAQQRRLHAELELERAALERLNAVGRTISAELDHRRLAQIVVDAATELTGAEFGAF